MSSVATQTLPDAQGHFGPYGGMFVPETLMAPLQELAQAGELAELTQMVEQLRKGAAK